MQGQAWICTWTPMQSTLAMMDTAWPCVHPFRLSGEPRWTQTWLYCFQLLIFCFGSFIWLSRWQLWEIGSPSNGIFCQQYQIQVSAPLYFIRYVFLRVVSCPELLPSTCPYQIFLCGWSRWSDRFDKLAVGHFHCAGTQGIANFAGTSWFTRKDYRCFEYEESAHGSVSIPLVESCPPVIV